ncbi:uncharacterized protein LOC108049365 [Drosophila rhopaloa]|uniref:Uncharacterized protein LOC108049365 n=1 Tax=Drosophila rhopaloa TaxID=1041015 RepID=A0A6P4FA83_DRORH|nr:uncharacterized protein LOC108049365 [Drosophila rhopaloa]
MEDISVVTKLCDDNVHKLQENLRSFQREVSRVRKVLTERWVNVDRRDRRLIALHDRLVRSLSDVNACVIQLNLNIELNRPDGRFTADDKSDDSFDDLYPSNRLIQKAIEGLGFNKPDEQPPEPPFAEKMPESSMQVEPASTEKLPESSMQLVAVDLSMVPEPMVEAFFPDVPPPPPFPSVIVPKLPMIVVEPPALPSAIVPKLPMMEDNESPLASKESFQTISHDISNQKSMTELQIEEKAVVVEPQVYSAVPIENQATPTANQVDQSPEVVIQTTNNDISHEISKKDDELQIEKLSVAKQMPSSWLIEPSSDQVTTSPPPKRFLMAPKGGTQTTSDGIYKQILKNTAAFPKNAVVSAALVHVNVAGNCIFVAKFDESSKRIKEMLKGQVLLQELEQLPDYGDIFAVYDSSDNIITRITINNSSEGGGYDGYLIDYGEHIHLTGNEIIFELPDDIRCLPAEAIRCNLTNCGVDQMSSFLYQIVQLRVHENNGIGLVVELIDENKPDSNENKTDIECPAKLSEEDMAMLNEIEETTSDPLKAVLGFKPTDEQRICRHYDPKLNGCFKGNTCRLVHEPFAPHGATKDVEIAGALPETVFDTPVPHKVGSSARILITFVNSPTEVYAQFVDGSAPLVWAKKDVPEVKWSFKRRPRILDIVLALYNDDCFYRAQIIDEMDREYKIFYVDYGNTEFVSLSSLAPCEYAESLKPHQSVSCQIEGVVRSTFLSHQMTFECVEYLKSKLLNKEMDVKLVSRLPDGFLIRFLGIYSDVPRQLVKRRYAQPSNGIRRSLADLDKCTAEEDASDI